MPLSSSEREPKWASTSVSFSSKTGAGTALRLERGPSSEKSWKWVCCCLLTFVYYLKRFFTPISTQFISYNFAPRRVLLCVKCAQKVSSKIDSMNAVSKWTAKCADLDYELIPWKNRNGSVLTMHNFLFILQAILFNQQLRRSNRNPHLPAILPPAL